MTKSLNTQNVFFQTAAYCIHWPFFMYWPTIYAFNNLNRTTIMYEKKDFPLRYILSCFLLSICPFRFFLKLSQCTVCFHICPSVGESSVSLYFVAELYFFHIQIELKGISWDHYIHPPPPNTIKLHSSPKAALKIYSDCIMLNQFAFCSQNSDLEIQLLQELIWS